jgi:hypothetical protein
MQYGGITLLEMPNIPLAARGRPDPGITRYCGQDMGSICGQFMPPGSDADDPIGPWYSPGQTGRQFPAASLRALRDLTTEIGNVRATAIQAGLSTAAFDKIEQGKEWFDKLAAVERAYASNDPTGVEQAETIINMISSLATLAGPYGAIVGAVLQALGRLGTWLVRTYPATALYCMKYVDTEIPRKLGYTGVDAAAHAYADDGWLYLASTLAKLDTLPHRSLSWYNTGESWGTPRFDLGTSGSPFTGRRWEDLISILKPRRDYSTPRPAGFRYRSWGEWERAHPEAPVIVGVEEARTKYAQDLVAQLQARGDLRYLSGMMGDLCWFSAYAFKVSALPNSTLLELIRLVSKMAVSEEARTEIDESLLQAALLEEPIPVSTDLPEGGLMVWSDQLAMALAHYIEQSNFIDYHMAGLLLEYSKRRGSGALKFASDPPAGGAAEGGTGAGTVVAVAAGIAALGGLAWLLLRK